MVYGSKIKIKLQNKKLLTGSTTIVFYYQLIVCLTKLFYNFFRKIH